MSHPRGHRPSTRNGASGNPPNPEHECARACTEYCKSSSECFLLIGCLWPRYEETRTDTQSSQVSCTYVLHRVRIASLTSPKLPASTTRTHAVVAVRCLSFALVHSPPSQIPRGDPAVRPAASTDRPSGLAPRPRRRQRSLRQAIIHSP